MAIKNMRKAVGTYDSIRNDESMERIATMAGMMCTHELWMHYTEDRTAIDSFVHFIVPERGSMKSFGRISNEYTTWKGGEKDILRSMNIVAEYSVSDMLCQDGPDYV